MRIVFFGTSNVALPILEALHKNHEVVGVVTTPDTKQGKKQQLMESPVSVLASELKLPLLKPENPSDQQFLAQLQNFNAEIFIVVSYGKILPESVINLPPYRTVNVHFSKLPELRGPAPIQFTLLEGRTEAWTSIFVLDKEVDHGPVLAQTSMPVDPSDNFVTLSQSLARLSADLLIDTLPDYISGRLKPREQDHSKATGTRHIERGDAKVDWQKTAQEIYNQFRAFYPWPGLMTKWKGKTIKILECYPGEQTTSTPGTVLTDGSVACGQGTTLQIINLQLEGKKEVSFNDFINGYRNFIDSKLE